MPSPLYAACCSPAPAHTHLTPAAPSAPCSMNIHEQQAAARSGLSARYEELKSGPSRIWCRPYKLCSYLNSQPKWPGNLDLLTLKVVSESRVTWPTSVPILVFLGLSVLDLGPIYTTDRRQTSDSIIA